MRATQKVMHTVELMEIILLNLPMRNLFTIQGTNTTFRDSIKNSKVMRREMFLEPEIIAKGPPTPAKLNPLLYATMLLPGEKELPAAWSFDGLPRHHEDDQDAEAATLEVPHWQEGEYLRPQTQFLCVPRRMEAGKRVEGESWRQMMVVQHASTAQILVKFGGGKERKTFVPETKKLFNRSCTFAELYDWVQEQREAHGADAEVTFTGRSSSML